MPTTQAKRTIQITSPLGKDALLVSQFSGVEQLSTLFQFDLELVSEKGDLHVEDILGKDVTINFDLPSGAKRHFHGFVTEFSQGSYDRRFHQYRATVRPWLWFLTRSADCRIFQNKSVAEIFEEVVKPYGFTDYKLKLTGAANKFEYCVQYRETDFNFISRLLEQEGICYWFQHAEGRHTMMLANDTSAHEKASGYETVPYFPPDSPEAARKRDHLAEWSFSKSVLPGTFATTDYDFTAPKKSLAGNSSISKSHSRANFEVFDYPADLAKFESSETSRVAKIRVQELQATHMVAHGKGDAAGLATGYKFKLDQYPRKDLNIEYLVTGAKYLVTNDPLTAGGAGAGAQCVVNVDAIDAKTPFRPARVTPRPTVQGAQTAIVVGKAGEDIYTDEHARVKVQFHWDRVGKSDENSGCWIRVAQTWAGKQWGAIHIPRIGQEVIVDFLEGDPDKPIITGRVYNGANMPPYDLPANKTQSGVKSRSSKDGSPANFNEIRFEDKKGSEQLLIHAEKNQDIEVENDETHWVGHDRKKTVDNDETSHIKGNRTETVDKDETITISGNRTETVGKDETISISKARTETVGDNETVSIGKDQQHSVGGNRTRNVTKDESITIGKKQDNSVGDARTTSVAKDDSLSVGKKLTIDAGDQITLKTGSASIVLKKDGTITIKGKDITIDGSGKVNVKASSDVTIKGSKINQN
ncbi:MAG TPA: type VI secretion system tip protein TssI/VgrG [Steroidobacteraceae bacterium]|nr:type VI secretion system tip protein TssI/VgrG [Steroidobacteraceae bacterium]